jgi:bacteriorhodopsin
LETPSRTSLPTTSSQCALTREQQKRLFHLLTTFITAIATLSYFAQATGSGSSFSHHFVIVDHQHGLPTTLEHVFRQVFWARYVDWALTTPLILLNLAFLAGLDGSNILVALFADLAMVVTGLFFAYARTEAPRWGWYAMSCVAYLVVVHQLVVPGRRAVLNKDRKIGKIFALIGGFTVVVWALYPVVWGKFYRLWKRDIEYVADLINSYWRWSSQVER